MILLLTLIFIIVTCFYGCMNKTMIKNKKLLIFVFFILLFFILGGRNYNFGDNLQYRKNFDVIATLSWSEIIFNSNKEYLQNILMKIISVLGFGSQSYFYISVGISLYGIFKFIIKKSVNMYASILFYISVGTIYTICNITRQYIAISLILLAALAVEENKVFKALFLYFCSIGFHITAIIILPIYLSILFIDKKIKMIQNKYILFFICSLIGIYLLKPILEKVFLSSSSDSTIANLTSISQLGKIGQYGANTASMIYILLGIFIFIINFYFIDNKNKNFKILFDSFSQELYNSFYYIFVILGCFSSVLYFRISEYFLPIVIISLANKFIQTKKVDNNTKLLVMFSFLFLFIINTLGPNIEYIRNYSFNMFF